MTLKNGDLSNIVGITVAFKCTGFLLNEKEPNLLNKLSRVLFKACKWEVNLHVASIMDRIFRNTEMTVDLVVFKDEYTDDLKALIDDLPFNRIILVDKIVQVSQRLLIGDITYYVDDDPIRRSLVNNIHAKSLQEFMNEIRGVI